ncbi:hypothetical protein M378DRAFT_46513, partial [Amanita muscaria Koide BX008]
LPRAEAAFDDYQSQKKNGLCLKGTRETLLGELGSWLVDPTRSRIYVLSGLAGIGKSTIAYTFASRADKLGIIGASFFFSRDESDRKTAKKFFTTIAYQLCVYDKAFAKAIGDALLNERGSAAITKDLNEQLEALILEPLRDVVKSRVQPTVIVIDALDECDDRDATTVLASLERLVHNFPSFKVLITTRPQPHLDHRLNNHNVFYLQNIEDKIINNDIRLYLKFSLSRANKVIQVLFSQDSSMFASLNGRDAKFWDAVTGAPIGTIVDKVSAISDDFSTAASYNDGLITLYDVNSCTSLATLNVAPASVVKLAISPDGCRLAAGLSDSTVCLWNWSSADPVVQRLHQFAWNEELNFSPDCSRLTSCHADGTIGLWDTGCSRQLISTLKTKGRKVKSCIFSTDGSHLVSASFRSAIKLWDCRNGARIGTLKPTNPTVTSMVFLRGMLAVRSQTDHDSDSPKSDITLWDTKT